MAVDAFRRLTSRYSAASSLVRRITTDNGIGPSMHELQEVCNLASRPKSSADVFYMLESRLKQSAKHWQSLCKALEVANYILLQGGKNAVDWLKMHRYLFVRLKTMQVLDPDNNDNGSAIRQRANRIAELLTDEDKLDEERAHYERTRNEVRTSIGRQTVSGHTLGMVRGLEDESFDEAAEDAENVSPAHNFASQMPRKSLQMPLDVIQEEVEGRAS